jgi:undecaprenyl pyrophosphate phosphatase UppP
MATITKPFGVMSVSDLHVIRILLIIILFWHGIWSLTDEAIHMVQRQHGVERWKCYLAVVLIALIIIILDPHTFDKL